jgi:hypothetical protein
MAVYRLYFFNAQGHIRHAREFECANDDEAIQTVEQHRDGRYLELWSGARVVHRFPVPEGFRERRVTGWNPSAPTRH